MARRQSWESPGPQGRCTTEVPSPPAVRHCPSARPTRVASTGGHRLVNARTSLCAQAGPGRAVTLQLCQDRPEQLWQLLPDRDGARIRNAATGLCLGNGGRSSDQAPVLQEDCAAASPDQSWRAVTDGRPHPVVNQGSGRWLGVTHWPDPGGPGETLTQSGNYYNSLSFRWTLDDAARPTGR
ncbi:RICIN domain-containing protein [Kitasatospora sp. NPDC004240]